MGGFKVVLGKKIKWWWGRGEWEMGYDTSYRNCALEGGRVEIERRETIADIERRRRGTRERARDSNPNPAALF